MITRKRIYATGGEGAISVIQQQDADHYKEFAKIATVSGARTGLFSPELDRLFVPKLCINCSTRAKSGWLNPLFSAVTSSKNWSRPAGVTMTSMWKFWKACAVPRGANAELRAPPVKRCPSTSQVRSPSST